MNQKNEEDFTMNKSDPEENKQISVDERPKLFSKNPNKEKSEKIEYEDEEENDQYNEKEEYSNKDSMINESDDEYLNKDDSNINPPTEKLADIKNNNSDDEIY